MVFLDYDQAGLDAQYALRARHPDHETFFARYAENSERARRSLPCSLDLAYGPGAGETLDVFPAAGPGAPLHMFIHGGYWRSLDKSDFGFVAEGLAPAGVTVAVVNYALAPAVDMDEIVRQNRAAAAWLWRNAGRFNADPDRLFVSGHSAGGHLTAMLMATDWPAFGGLPADLVKGGCAISGVFELEPVRLSALNADIGIDEASARRNSPRFGLPERPAPLIVAVGGDETEEFLRQSRDFHAAWTARGYPAVSIEAPGLHHFDVVEELGDRESPICRAVIAQMCVGRDIL